MKNTEMIDNMIDWAEEQLGSRYYAGLCLAFIEEALEISNSIEIFGGDSARESLEMYRDALQTGVPERGAFVFYDCLCPGPDGPMNWGHCGICLGDGNVIHSWDCIRVDHFRQIESMRTLVGDYPRYRGWVPISRVLAQESDRCE
ncbi:MAG: hypothetical protein QM270_10090 [Bacillota bacterium]|nr:hypothetical protein [Bacillota bacterium]